MRNLPVVNTLVVKIGSNILTDVRKGINPEIISSLAKTLSEIKKTVANIVIVSSGAVGSGFKVLGFDERPKNITDKQACASVGQARLIWQYEKEFKKHGHLVGQILITKDDFSNRRRYLNASYTIRRLFEFGVIPIINENDSVVVEELKHVETFGDNDNLSALVAGLIGADMLLILSDVNGLYDSNPEINPDAKRISEVEYVDENMLSVAGESVSGVGTGGMKSKLTAADKALRAGCYVGIINGRNCENINDFLAGKDVGTFFSHIEDPVSRKKHWMAYSANTMGVLVLDEGAARAILTNKKSLLPSGVTDVSGTFGIGDILSIQDSSGKEIARGKARYASEDMERIMGENSSEIFDILGYKFSDEVVHKDDLVVL